MCLLCSLCLVRLLSLLCLLCLLGFACFAWLGLAPEDVRRPQEAPKRPQEAPSRAEPSRAEPRPSHLLLPFLPHLACMDRAAVALVVWTRAQRMGLLGLIALQTATHGDWRPARDERLALRTASPAMQWIVDKRDAEGRTSRPHAQERAELR